MTDGSDRRGGLLEKHLQTILISAVVVILGWVWNTVTDSYKEIAVVNTQMVSVQKDIDILKTEVRAGMDDRFRRQDFRTEMSPIKALLIDHSKRIASLEQAISRIEERCEACSSKTE